MNTRRRFDLITMGRAIIDIYAEQKGCRLEDVSSFAKYVGGCPANIAIGTARLGLRVAMITRVGNEQHGRFLREQLTREGIDVSHVVTDPQRLTGVAFLGIKDQETFPLLHYRDDCADMAISPDDYDEDFLRQSKAFLFSGSHLTTEAAAHNLEVAVTRAQAAGTKVIFDIDYRPGFWELVGRDAGENRYVVSEEVTKASQRHLGSCDLIVGTEEEIRIAGGAADTMTALQAIRERSAGAIVLKRGAKGCMVFPEDIPSTIDGGIVGAAFPVEIFNLVGAGDGFMSGFLSGWLRDQSWEQCCRFGNGCGAIVVSRHGCSPASPTAPELEFFLKQGASRPDLHRDKSLERIHRITTRRCRPDPVFVIACDETERFEKLQREDRTILRFNSVMAETAIKLHQSLPQTGVLFHDSLGTGALASVGSAIDWTARRIEMSGAHPLTFHDSLPASVLLHQWPRYQIVKCRVPEISLDDPLQKERLIELRYAVDVAGMELLLQLDHLGSGNDLQEIAMLIRDVQSLDICPDWWMLPCFFDAASWKSIETVISAQNPSCRGILLFCDGADSSAAEKAIRSLPEVSLVKGFVVAAQLYSQAAESWFAGSISDDDFAAELIKRTCKLADAWLARRDALPARTARSI